MSQSFVRDAKRQVDEVATPLVFFWGLLIASQYGVAKSSAAVDIDEGICKRNSVALSFVQHVKRHLS